MWTRAKKGAGMAPQHKRARVRRLVVGAAAVVVSAALAAGRAAGVQVLGPASPPVPVPPPTRPVVAVPAVPAPAVTPAAGNPPAVPGLPKPPAVTPPAPGVRWPDFGAFLGSDAGGV